MTTLNGLYRGLFPGATNGVYMDTASVGLISTRVAHAVSDFTLAQMTRGVADGPRREQEKVLARKAVADLVGGASDRVAFTQNTSTGLALVANGIDWVDGDNVVVPAGEFPSNFYVWTRLRRRGVTIREVAMSNGHATVQSIAEAVDSSTRVLSVSAVQYSSGYRYDLHALAEIAHASGALFVVDGSQSVGALVTDADDIGVDVLAVGAHKWMLGPTGIGFAHFSTRAIHDLQPSTVGWLSVDDPYAFDHEPRLADDARRFESGTENLAGIAGLRQAAEQVLELGREEVERNVLELAETTEIALLELGWSSLRSRNRKHWSGAVFATSNHDDQGIHSRLADAKVHCSLRGAGIRFAPHYFNNADDVSAIRAALR